MDIIKASRMLRLSGPVCPFCEVSSLFASSPSQWTSSRGAATLAKRRPSRMILSSRVRSGPRVQASDENSTKPKKPERDGPFGGMNRTTVPRDLLARQNAFTKPTSKESVPGKKQDISRKPGQDKRRGNDKGDRGMHALKMQQRLHDVSYGERSRIKKQLSGLDTFDEFDLLPIIQEAISKGPLKGMTDLSPTPVQRLAVPALLDRDTRRRTSKERDTNKMKQFLLAAETGSGKTLAYILPIIDSIKRAEAEEQRQAEFEKLMAQARRGEELKNKMFELPNPEKEVSDPDTARPRALILLPTAELVAQVGSVFKSLSHTVKYRTAVISAAYTPTVIKSRLFSPGGVDVVVSTPQLFNSIAENDPNILSRLQYLVVDEADSLLDRSFSPITSAIIDRAAPSLRQLIMCSATIPRSLDAYIAKRYPETRRLATPHLHAIPRRVQLTAVDIDKIPYQGNRQLACAQVIWDIAKEASERDESLMKKIIVFVNERDTAQELHDYLQSKGIAAFRFARDRDPKVNDEILAKFTSATPDEDAEEVAGNVATKHTQVLVATDIASRGIDTVLVKHVILYDVPHTTIDFIHRLGRLGRMGRRGKAVVLMGRNDRKDVVKEVREGMYKGSALI